VADDIVQRLAREHDFRVFTASDDLPGITMMSEDERRQEAADEIQRLRAVERRSHDLWWLAYHHGPVTLTVRGGHEMYRIVTVDGISYNFDDPADVAFLAARHDR
jgi:hypothetical protein